MNTATLTNIESNNENKQSNANNNWKPQQWTITNIDNSSNNKHSNTEKIDNSNNNEHQQLLKTTTPMIAAATSTEDGTTNNQQQLLILQQLEKIWQQERLTRARIKAATIKIYQCAAILIKQQQTSISNNNTKIYNSMNNIQTMTKVDSKQRNYKKQRKRQIQQ